MGPMGDESGLDSLRGLHQDLIALSESQLRNVDRLWAKLDACVDEFKRLLDKPHKSEKSRKTLQSGTQLLGIRSTVWLVTRTNISLPGTINIQEDEYAVNQEFQESAIQLAEVLDLDEIESARLLLEVQDAAETLGRSIIPSAVFHFHQRRTWLLDCLRLLLTLATNVDIEDDIRSNFRDLLGLILETKDGPARNGSLYIRRCLDSMAEIEIWAQALAERKQGALAMGQAPDPDFDEVVAFQQQSLGQQHETLGAIINTLIKANYSGADDFLKLLEYMPKVARWNASALHYVPIITAFATEYGSSDGSGSLRDARIINQRIMDSRANAPWPLRSLQAAMVTWWLAEYSGWYSEEPSRSPLQGVNLEEEARQRSEVFFQALNDGAFQCTLSICSQIVPFEWYDPSRTGLIEFLLRDSSYLPQDLGVPPSYFQELIMEQFETFTDAFITNMPDTLRRFKSEEDFQRKNFLASLPNESRAGAFDQPLHLERFLVIISFAFDNRIEAAQSFWSDVDSNLYGFLQWASKRQSTPFVGAFCEMLRSISQGEDAATSAHHFLLEEGTVASSKIRRTSSLSWAQIFGELNLYTAKIREQPQTTRPGNTYASKQGVDDIDEPESVIMLQTYLRLVSHLCRESAIARAWVLSQPDLHILDLMFYLCNNTVPSRLQACAFNVLQSLLTAKTLDTSTAIWTNLDKWVSGAYNPSPNIPRPSKVSNPAAWAEEMTLGAIASDFEQANNFVGLLQALVLPAEQSTELNDHIPFPENLGQAYRMPGIEPYIDFVMGKVFSPVAPQIERSLERRVLNWNILNFVVTCLATFNEDLVILSNKSTTAVDEAMNTSSLLSYVRLHPFSRVMAWMFNDKVLAALFGATHQPIDDLSNASAESPLVLSLIRGIETMNLVMDLQSVYFDLVRPLIKDDSAGRRKPVMNPSLTSFEDSVSMNLDLVVDLGLYAGIGNQDLTVSSLKLLEKLSSSRKLNIQPPPGSSNGLHGNRMIGALEQHGDLERVARSLSLAMDFDEREIELGPISPVWTIKSMILDFLINCLSGLNGRPTIAHALLGFTCHGPTVDVEPDGLLASGSSLFHAVLHLVQEYPEGVELDMQLWALSLRQKAMDILSILWVSPLTSSLVLPELRANDFLFTLFLQQHLLDLNTTWDGRVLRDPDFMFTDSAEALQQALWQRCSLMKYAAIESRLVIAENVPSLRTKIFSTFLGATITPDGEHLSNATIFDLLDFVELVTINSAPAPQYYYFAGVDFSVSSEGEPSIFGSFHNIKLIEELINLRLNELKRTGRLEDPNEVQKIDTEAMTIIQSFQSENNQRQLRSARQQTLTAWTDLLAIIVGICDPEHADRAGLILQSFQLITPKLEHFVSINAPEAIVMARLVQALLFQLDFKSTALDQSRAGGVANDRLFQVYRTTLRAIPCPGLSSPLREILYTISYHYLSGMTENFSTPTHHRNGIKSIKLAGDKMMDIICDDAYGASPTCRIAALLLLDSLAEITISDGSDYIINSLVRTNFLQILVESVETMPQDLRDTPAQDVPLLLVFYSWKLSLLLTLSRSKLGASLLVNAGLFPAIRGSGLFSVDPDIGIEIDNPEALSQYYRLLLALTRVVTSVTLTRGAQNDAMIAQARGFLVENRALLVAVFKREAKIGGVSFDDKGGGGSVEELVELFGVLIELTGFLDVSGNLPWNCMGFELTCLLQYEEQSEIHKARKLGFS